MPQILHMNKSAHQDIPCHARDIFTDDADCLARSISGWSQKYEQIKAGHFQGSLSELCLGEAQLFVEQTSHALRQECTVPPEYIWFGLPQSKLRRVRINGIEVQDGRLALHRGGESFELVTPDDLQFWGIVVKEDVLMSYAQQFECEAWLSDVLAHPVLGVNAAKKQAIQQICGRILSLPRQAKYSPLPDPLRQSLSDNILSALFSLIQAVEPVPASRISGRQRHRLVELADAYVRSHRDRLVTVSELCVALSTSRRSMQIVFQDVLGVSPHAYIRAVSLNGVRSHLNNANSPYVSVQDAAAAYGFWHMSQFALDYRQLFGERPSETIKRRGQPQLE